MDFNKTIGNYRIERYSKYIYSGNKKNRIFFFRLLENGLLKSEGQSSEEILEHIMLIEFNYNIKDKRVIDDNEFFNIKIGETIDITKYKYGAKEKDANRLIYFPIADLKDWDQVIVYTNLESIVVKIEFTRYFSDSRKMHDFYITLARSFYKKYFEVAPYNQIIEKAQSENTLQTNIASALEWNNVIILHGLTDEELLLKEFRQYYFKEMTRLFKPSMNNDFFIFFKSNKISNITILENENARLVKMIVETNDFNKTKIDKINIDM